MNSIAFEHLPFYQPFPYRNYPFTPKTYINNAIESLTSPSTTTVGTILSPSIMTIPMHPFDHPESKYVIMGYLSQSSTYNRQFSAKSIQASKLSHVYYSFANVLEDGEIVLTDSWIDTDKPEKHIFWNELGGGLLNGNLGALFRLKSENRNLKVCLCVGGGTYSKNFVSVAKDEQKRTKFVNSAAALIENLGLDGIEIDWVSVQCNLF